jgi:hypothetical protein
MNYQATGIDAGTGEGGLALKNNRIFSRRNLRDARKLSHFFRVAARLRGCHPETHVVSHATPQGVLRELP